MQNTLKMLIRTYMVKRSRQRRLVALLCVLSVMTALGVYAALMLPAIGAEKENPLLTADLSNAVFGNRLAARVTATAATHLDETYFYLSANTENTELLDLLFWENFDGTESAQVFTQDGGTLTLHRINSFGTVTGYWFTLPNGKTTTFYLPYNSVQVPRTPAAPPAVTPPDWIPQPETPPTETDPPMITTAPPVIETTVLVETQPPMEPVSVTETVPELPLSTLPEQSGGEQTSGETSFPDAEVIITTPAETAPPPTAPATTEFQTALPPETTQTTTLHIPVYGNPDAASVVIYSAYGGSLGEAQYAAETNFKPSLTLRWMTPAALDALPAETSATEAPAETGPATSATTATDFPTFPVFPIDPVFPADPEIPVIPIDPEIPGEPGGPEFPTIPEYPEIPENPDGAVDPAAPPLAVVPEIPDWATSWATVYKPEAAQISGFSVSNSMTTDLDSFTSFTALETGIDFGQYITTATVYGLQNELWVESTEFIDGDTVKVALTYVLPANTIGVNNKTISYQLPGGVVPGREESGIVYNENTAAGIYTISGDGLITIVFDDSFADDQGFSGTIQFQGTVSTLQDGTQNEITFGGSGAMSFSLQAFSSVVTNSITVYPNIISISGVYDAVAGKITWTITINLGKIGLLPYTVNNTLGGKANIQVKNSAGKVISGATLPFKVSSTSYETYTITYTTPAPTGTPGTSTTVSDTATLTKDSSSYSSTASVVVQHVNAGINQRIDKRASKTGALDAHTSWHDTSLFVNMSDSDYKGVVYYRVLLKSDSSTTGGMVMTDILPVGATLVNDADSVKVMIYISDYDYKNLDESTKYPFYNITTNSSYTTTPNADGTTTLTVTIKSGYSANITAAIFYKLSFAQHEVWSDPSVMAYTYFNRASWNGYSDTQSVTLKRNSSSGQGSLSIQKVWQDANGQPTSPTSGSVQMKLYRQAKNVAGYTVTVRYTGTNNQSIEQIIKVAGGSSLTITIPDQWNQTYTINNNGVTGTFNSTGFSYAAYTYPSINQNSLIVIKGNIYAPVPFELSGYINPPPGSSIGSPTLVNTITLNAAGSWRWSSSTLPLSDSNGNLYYYWVDEVNPGGSTVSYLNNDGIRVGKITVINNVSSDVYVLPSTGGSGSLFYYILGTLLMALSAGMLRRVKKKQR